MLQTFAPSSPDQHTGPNPRCVAWFCVRTQIKHEHIAAAHLRLLGEGDIEVFHPRIRFTRATRRGPVAAIESLFPNYLFARFDWNQYLNLVQYATGVSGIVHFGKHWPTIPEQVIEELREFFGDDTIREIPLAPQVGETVFVSRGVFEGLEALVTRVLPGGQRVAVLLQFLGQQTTVELETVDLVRNTRDQLAHKLQFAKSSGSNSSSVATEQQSL